MKKTLIHLLLLASLLLSSCQPATKDVKSDVWWKDAVFYEAFVRSFYDSNADGIGDFNGITAKLDYLNSGKPGDRNSLGINGVWLMPVFPSPSYHGYDVTDYYTVNPQYGTLDEFKTMLNEMHKRGIHLIIDFVINHTSNRHPWFEASASGDPQYKDWYIWSDTRPQYSGPWGETVWHSSGERFYYAIFVSEMPDLNYKKPAVTEEIYKIARFWLIDVGIDGFRIDGAKHLIEKDQVQENTAETRAWLKEFTAYVKTVKPDALVVGEILSSSDQVAPYVNDGDLDLAFNFDFASGVLNGVKSEFAAGLGGMFTQQSKAYTSGTYAPILSNHDFDRSFNVLGENELRAKAAATLLLTAPGVPFLYYGEEIGMKGKKPDEFIRAPLQWDSGANAGFTTGTPWSMIYPDYETKNIAAALKDPASLLNHYRALIQVRAGHAALRGSLVLPVSASASTLFAMLRANSQEAILVLVNLTAEPVTNPTLSWYDTPIQGKLKARVLFGEGKPTPLTVGEDGTVKDYAALEEIPGGGSVIIQFLP